MSVSRVAAWAVAVVVGAVYGAAATIAHAYRLGFFPLGLILAVAGSLAFLIALRALTRDRWMSLAGGIGMLAAALLFSSVGPGGSAIVAAATAETAWIAMAWSLAVPLMVGAVVAWPDLSHSSEGT